MYLCVSVRVCVCCMCVCVCVLHVRVCVHVRVYVCVSVWVCVLEKALLTCKPFLASADCVYSLSEWHTGIDTAAM